LLQWSVFTAKLHEWKMSNLSGQKEKFRGPCRT
jgi:hypothetical protein